MADREINVSDSAGLVDSVTVSMRSYYSTRYLWSAEHHARLAGDIEDTHQGQSVFLLRHAVYVIDSITDAVAFAEAAVNEVAQDVADKHESYVVTLNESARERIAGYWVAASEASTLAKYSAIKEFVTGSPLDFGREPTQSMSALIKLRNHLVHYKPADVSEAYDPPKLVQLLKDRFPDNALMAQSGNPWFPDKALGAGCARWAAATARDFVDTWSHELGLSLNVHRLDWSNEPP